MSLCRGFGVWYTLSVETFSFHHGEMKYAIDDLRPSIWRPDS